MMERSHNLAVDTARSFVIDKLAPKDMVTPFDSIPALERYDEIIRTTPKIQASISVMPHLERSIGTPTAAVLDELRSAGVSASQRTLRAGRRKYG